MEVQHLHATLTSQCAAQSEIADLICLCAAIYGHWALATTANLLFSKARISKKLRHTVIVKNQGNIVVSIGFGGLSITRN